MPDEKGNETLAEKITRIKSEGGTTAHLTSVEEKAPTKSIDSTKAATDLGEKTAQVSSGAPKGEKVRETPAGRLAESNDVVLGDQSSRANGPKATTPATRHVADGSTSPHDASSGGSRQDAAHAQAIAGKDAAKAAIKDPAFQAEAKARTI